MKKRIYLDHAATTYMDPRVKAAMEPYWEKNFGNPSSIYEEGRAAKKAIAGARLKVASVINARPDEIIFTAGGTESDNLAVFGLARSSVGGRTSHRPSHRPHIIVSKIEHHAILHPCQALGDFEISYISVDKNGIVGLEELKNTLKKETILVSIMYANNEIGSIQPIAEIAKIIRKHGGKVLFHTDAVQAPPYLDLNVLKLGVDLMTLNGSKIYGPKGIGCLYKKRNVKLKPILYGGGQEAGLRSGTENVPAIVGFAAALELAQKDREKESKRLEKLRNYFVERILKMEPSARLNGSLENRLPNNVNISFCGVEGESIVLYLDAKGVACSTGSACSSDSLEPSHVIMAIKTPPKYAHGSVRFTLGKKTIKKDIDYVLKVLPGIIKKLKNISAI
ncbi:cysteine desulfurase [Patescibacteria group bacterium]|nr:cysteine desulfurase [Patescibacteria group bacterium]